MKQKFITNYLYLHLLELKHHLFLFFITYLYLFSICYNYSDQLIYILISPLLELQILKYFIYTNITDIFIINLYISLTISLLLIIPFLLFQGWFFFSKGLYKYENIILLKTYIFFIFFSYFIIYFIFLKIIHKIWFFFFNIHFSNNYIFNIYFEPQLNNYFYFILTSFIYIYILFLYPFLLLILIVCRILKIKTIIFFRKLFYFKFILISAFITPPDITNQILISLPFIFVFESYIYIYFYINKYKNITL